MGVIRWTRTSLGWNGIDRDGGEYTIRRARHPVTMRVGYRLTEPDGPHAVFMYTVSEAKECARRGAP